MTKTVIAATVAVCLLLPSAVRADSDSEWGESSSARSMPQLSVPQDEPQSEDQAQNQVVLGGQDYKLSPGAASLEERAIAARIGIQREPRLQIMDFVNSIGATSPALPYGQVQFISSPELEKLFPDWMVYVVRFPRTHVSLKLPENLSNNNVFIVKKTGRMALIASTDELQCFFTQTQSASTDIQARSLVYIWLQLVTELIQDGQYRFTIQDDTVSVSNRDADVVASGKAVVDATTGKGDVFVTLVFDSTGKLKGVEEKNTVRPGISPATQQATSGVIE